RLVYTVGEMYRRPARGLLSRPPVHLADRVVIGVEEVEVALVGRLVARGGREEAEALEEPRDVREVPHRRADLGDGLNDLVLGRQRLGEHEARIPHAAVARRQRFGLMRRGLWW